LPATLTDVSGDEVTVTDISRIIPLNGEITEVIYALGLGDNVVGVDISATYPPEAADKPSIGYQRTLSAEGIISLNPP
jgi:iron complex transport system substrate-binding protein